MSLSYTIIINLHSLLIRYDKKSTTANQKEKRENTPMSSTQDEASFINGHMPFSTFLHSISTIHHRHHSHSHTPKSKHVYCKKSRAGIPLPYFRTPDPPLGLLQGPCLSRRSSHHSRHPKKPSLGTNQLFSSSPNPAPSPNSVFKPQLK